MLRTDTNEFEQIERAIFLSSFSGVLPDAVILKLSLRDAKRFINERMQLPTSAIGCREHLQTRNERYGKINLVKSGYGNLYLHHVALLAANRRSDLELVIGTNANLSPNDPGRLQVSHLCHNSHCILESHLVVERADFNLARNSCHGAYQVRFTIGEDKYVIDPCPHRIAPLYKACILPVMDREIHPGRNSLY